MTSASRAHVGASPTYRVVNCTQQRLLLEQVLLADTLGRKMRGLLGTKPTGRGQACWLTGCSSVHTLGMQYALDLYFLDRNGRILCIQNRLNPWRLSRWVPWARQVLEVEGGWIAVAHAVVGDVLAVRVGVDRLP